MDALPGNLGRRGDVLHCGTSGVRGAYRILELGDSALTVETGSTHPRDSFSLSREGFR